MTGRLVKRREAVLLVLALWFSGCQTNIPFNPLQIPPGSNQAATQDAAVLFFEPDPAEPAPVLNQAVQIAIANEQPAPETSVPAPTPVLPSENTALEVAEPASPSLTTEVTLAPSLALSAEQWKDWPVMPVISAEMRQVYLRGLAKGRNPNAFSILGDCQSQPDVFLGMFDSDPAASIVLPLPLRQTVDQFKGSFDRYSPTVKDGTTEGALLWVEWNDNKEKKCQHGETPLDCELRVHQPSIVFVHIGTHWESRQMNYMRKIIERVLLHGAVPVIVTKADNRELDEKINLSLVTLAVEYQLPVWNFWRTVQHLPNRGMEKDSSMYLNEEGLIVHRASGLEALDAVWRGLKE